MPVAAGQPRQQVLELRELDLRARLARARVQGEDVEDQARAGRGRARPRPRPSRGCAPGRARARRRRRPASPARRAPPRRSPRPRPCRCRSPDPGRRAPSRSGATTTPPAVSTSRSSSSRWSSRHGPRHALRRDADDEDALARRSLCHGRIVPARTVVLGFGMRALSRSELFSANASSRSTAATGPRPPTPIRSSSRGATPTAEDREVAGWIASAFAYGQVRTIQQNVGRLLATLGPRPARGARPHRATSARSRARSSPGFRHRFHGAADAAALLYAIARVRAEAGSVRAFFEARVPPEEDRDVAGLLSRAVARIEAFDYRPVLGTRRIPERSPVRFFFPDPADGLRLQALESLPALDGAPGRARLRPLAGHPDRPPRHSDRHARPPHRAAPRPDAPPDRRLEGGAADHGRRSRASTRATPCASTTRSAGSASSTSAIRATRLCRCAECPVAGSLLRRGADLHAAQDRRLAS